VVVHETNYEQNLNRGTLDIKSDLCHHDIFLDKAPIPPPPPNSTLWETPGKSYQRGRLSTIDLLVPTSSDKLLFIMNFFYLETQLSKQEERGQLFLYDVILF